jgi:hypothetical protein
MRRLVVFVLLASAACAATPAAPAPTTSASTGTPPGVLPDPHLTPGAVATTDTSTVCHRSTRTIRPLLSYTEDLKRRQIAEYGYADRRLSDYQEDHLVPLELGGAPSDPRNLWPQPRHTTPGAAEKDDLERLLHHRVCAGQISLVDAQRQIASNWYDLWVRLGRP